MGKHKNFSNHRMYFQKMYDDAKNDIKLLNIKNNALQQKNNEQKIKITVLEKRIEELQRQIEVKANIIEELESH